MKKLFITNLFLFAFLLVLNAQFPEFTRIDTGSIYESQGTLARFSGILFDIDNDGDLDPIISNKNAIGITASPLTLYKNERTGIYIQQKIFLPEYSNAFEVFHPSPMGDIDNDGDIDVIANSNFDKIGVFVNDGYGNFLSDTSINVQNSFNSSYPVLLDYNKDGHLDLLYFSLTVRVFYNDGNGKFPDRETITNINRPTSDWLHSMAWGDADNDGDMDVYCGFSKVAKNAFFINTGDSLEQVDENHITLSDTSMTPSVNWVDYDNDGDMDLCVIHEDPDTINGLLPALYENLGNLEFEKHILLDESYKGSFTISSYWCDLDNDGDQDLFITLEDGPYPFSGPYEGLYSPTLYNILCLNDGNGQFTNLLNHTLSLGEGHTAKVFDHDNDGDLDVLTIGNAYDALGHNHLYINEGNDNSSISISCVDKFNCATPYGTRIYAKTMIDGKYVCQTREIALIDGNVAFAYTPVHFGLGDADVIDTLLIRWPSGHVDEYIDVHSNQFFRAIEDSALVIDFNATNYIQYSPRIANLDLEGTGHSTNIDLREHYHFMKGDTVPAIVGDTLTFSIYHNGSSDTVQATLDGSILTLEALANTGSSKIQIIASAGFTERMDSFTVYIGQSSVPSNNIMNDLRIYPNPAHQELNISAKGSTINEVSIYSITGQKILQAGPVNGSIDISHLKTGMYIVEVSIENTRLRRKLIVE